MLQNVRDLPALYEAVEGSWCDLFRRLASAPGGECYEGPFLRRLYTAVPSDLFNGVYLATLSVDGVDQSIDEAVAFFTQRECPFRWWTGPLTKPRTLGSRLLAKGFRESSPISALALDLDALNPVDTVPSGFRMRPVEDVEALQAWFDTLRQGYEITAGYPQTWFAREVGLGFRDARIQRYLGYLQERPVATSCRFYTRGVVRINFVSTIPSARGRGVGTVMTTIPLQTAKLDGCKVAVLYPTQMGQNLYRRLGFKDVCTIASY